MLLWRRMGCNIDPPLLTSPSWQTIFLPGKACRRHLQLPQQERHGGLSPMQCMPPAALSLVAWQCRPEGVMFHLPGNDRRRYLPCCVACGKVLILRVRVFCVLVCVFGGAASLSYLWDTIWLQNSMKCRYSST